MQESELRKERLNQSAANLAALQGYERYFPESPGSVLSKLENFPKYVPREALTRFLARNEVFVKQLQVCGSVVELGVARGGSLLTWAQLSSIYEPANYTRQVIGFDSFGGFPRVSEQDRGPAEAEELVRQGGLAVEAGMKEDIERAAALWDMTRFLNHIPKVTVVGGDIAEALPRFVRENPHLVVSLLHLDADLYEPTKLGLELLRPRMPRGAVILFDQLNLKVFPGETAAVAEVVGLPRLKIERFMYCPNMAYAVVT